MLSLDAYRKIVILGQIMYGLAGVAVSIAGLVLLLSAPTSVINPISLEIGEMVLGVLMLGASGLGILAAIASQTAVFATYGILLGTIILLCGYGYFNTVHLAGKELMHKRFSALWTKLPSTTRMQIQEYGQCCGFESYLDRIQEPCKRYREQVGCRDTMAGFYAYQLGRLKVPAVMVMATTCILCFFTVLLFWMLRKQKKEDKKKLIPDRQPFDAWHKAVFQ